LLGIRLGERSYFKEERRVNLELRMVKKLRKEGRERMM